MGLRDILIRFSGVGDGLRCGPYQVRYPAAKPVMDKQAPNHQAGVRLCAHRNEKRRSPRLSIDDQGRRSTI
jgi:hypothetical protein